MDTTSLMIAFAAAVFVGAAPVVIQRLLRRETLNPLRRLRSLYRKVFPPTYPPPRILDVKLDVRPIRRAEHRVAVYADVTFSNEGRSTSDCEVSIEGCELQVSDDINWYMRFDRLSYYLHWPSRGSPEPERSFALLANSRVTKSIGMDSRVYELPKPPEAAVSVTFSCGAEIRPRPRRKLPDELRGQRVETIVWKGKASAALFDFGEVDQRRVLEEGRGVGYPREGEEDDWTPGPVSGPVPPSGLQSGIPNRTEDGN